MSKRSRTKRLGRGLRLESLARVLEKECLDRKTPSRIRLKKLKQLRRLDAIYPLPRFFWVRVARFPACREIARKTLQNKGVKGTSTMEFFGETLRSIMKSVEKEDL